MSMSEYSEFVATYANHGTLISEYDAVSLEAAYDKLKGCLHNNYAPEKVDLFVGRRKIVKVELKNRRDGREISIEKVYKVGLQLFVLCKHSPPICGCPPREPFMAELEVRVGDTDPSRVTVIPYIFNHMYNDVDAQGYHWITHESAYLHAILDAKKPSGSCQIL